MQPVEEVGKGHGGDTDAGHLAVERFLIAQQQVGLQFGGDLMQRGQLQGLLLGDDPDRLLQVLQGIPDGVEVVVLDAVDGDPEQVHLVLLQRLAGGVHRTPDLIRTVVVSADHEQDGRPEVQRHRDVQFELECRAGAGVVRALDQHDIAVGGQGVELAHDLRDQSVGVVQRSHLPGLVGGDPEGLLMGLVEAVAAIDQVDRRVVGARAGDHGPEVPDACRVPAERFHESQRDHRLPAGRFHRGHIHRFGHGHEPRHASATLQNGEDPVPVSRPSRRRRRRQRTGSRAVCRVDP